MENAKKLTNGKKSFIQLIKFALVGASNTIIDFVVSLVLNAIFHWYYVAKVVGYCLGVANSYLLNSRWTFKEERRKDAREIISFIIVNLVVLLISLGLMSLFKNLMHLDDWWMTTGIPEWFKKLIDGERACMLVSTCICIIINFVGNKLFVFKASTKAGAVKQ
ncbi:MAG: GtrA family protein [Christensenellaceae bacterium]|nr:GtrA family protein [Christensenellaceae bacterium]